MDAAEIATTTEVVTIGEAVMIATMTEVVMTSALIEVNDPGIATTMGVGSSGPSADGYRVTGPTGTIDVGTGAGYGFGDIMCIPGSGFGSHSVAAIADPGPIVARRSFHRPPGPARRS
jgi:hypothetical protein